MHAESYRWMESVFHGWLVDDELVLDVGSLDVNGTYRPIVEGYGAKYIGLDIRPGPNVDVVAEPYQYPFKGETFDIVISGSTMEHVEAPWLWLVELYRVLKKPAPLLLYTHMAWQEHPCPKDCWRVLPDGMAFILGWAGFDEWKIETNRSDIAAIAWKGIDLLPDL